jgi:hypothetical protein
MSREAIEEAIEVLEDASAEMLMETGDKNYYIEAIAVLRQALVDADDTSQKRVDEMVKTEHDRAVELGQAYERGWNAALAQQEPVAWISDSPTKGNGKQLHWTKAEAWRWSSNITPLYTAPPKQWVGLTDGEIDILSCETVKGNKSVNWLCKVLEAKLKERNI